MSLSNQADVIIVGAGPAGSTTALALGGAGYQVMLIDAATFPRDKVCGDAIPGLAIKTLKRINPALAHPFEDHPHHLRTRKTRFHWESQALELDWVLPAYTAKREVFDQQLLELVKSHTQTEIREGIRVQNVTVGQTGVQLETRSGPLTASLVIGCDGSRSRVARAIRPAKIDPKHHGGAVRQYMRGIRGLQPDRTEIFVQKAFLPGYFWVFPLADDLANVGFGMRSDEIARRRLNLKETLQAFIAASPELRERFDAATAVDAVQGYGLPFGSQQVAVSATRLLLTGDAACLVDPLSGDGIGYAMLSGYLAAQQAISSLEAGRFDAAYLQQYDHHLWNAIGPELRSRTSWQAQLGRFPWLATLGLRLAGLPFVKSRIQALV